MKIAVIGIGCVFPQSHSVEEFWKNLIQNKSCKSQLTEKQIQEDPQTYFKPKGNSDSYYNRIGGYIQDFQFNRSGYHLTNKELDSLSEKEQWTLQAAKDALKSAGYVHKTDLLKKRG